MSVVLEAERQKGKGEQAPWPPEYLACIPQEIPGWVRDLNHWTIWCYQKSTRGKHTKIPFDPKNHELHTGSGEERLKATTDFNTASHVLKVHGRSGGGKRLWSKGDRTELAGLMFLPTNTKGVLVIDLDGCTDDHGIPNQDAEPILQKFSGAYMERTPSGTGIRILVKTPARFTGIKAKAKHPVAGFTGVEFYTRDQLVSITGQLVGHQEDPLRPVGRDDALRDLMKLAGVEPDPTDQEKAERQQKQKETRAKKQAESRMRDGDEAELIKSALAKIPGADLHDTWIEIGQALQNWGEQTGQDAFEMWCEWASQSDKFTEEESERRWKSFKEEGKEGKAVTIGTLFHRAQEAGWIHPGYPKCLPDGHNSTDIGNARRLVANAGDSIRYCHGLGWLVWTGTRWMADPDGKRIRRRAQEVPARIRALSRKAEGDDKKRCLEHAEYSERTGAISNMIQEASAMPEVWVETDQLDQHHELLNTPSGMVDLRTGELLAHEPGKLMTKLAGIAYDPKAECPKFLESLSMYMQGDQEMIEYIQLLAGLGATGHSVEMVFFDFGSGANGKTTTRELINRVLGDYSVTIPADTLAVERFSNSNAPEPQKVRLMGARTAVCNEWDKNKTLDTTTLKRLCNTGKISARTLNKEPVEWVPTHSLFIQSNDEPKVILENEGERRRVRIIPWLFTIPREMRDSTMTDKMFKAEAPGILRWVVAGAVKYLELREAGKEIPIPEKAKTATTTFVEKCDPFTGFLDECCDQRGNLSDSSSGLYEAFRHYCNDGGFPSVDSRGFKSRMERAGFESKRTRDGVMWHGLARKNAGQQEAF